MEAASSQKELLAKIAELEGKLKDYERVQARMVELEQKLKEIEAAPKKEEEKVEPIPEKLFESEEAEAESKRATVATKKEVKIEEKKTKISKEKQGFEKQTKRQKLSFDAVQNRIKKFAKEGYKFRERKDRLFAYRWNKDTKKIEEHYIATMDDQVRQVLRQLKIRDNS
jgi:hypothetical protein